MKYIGKTPRTIVVHVSGRDNNNLWRTMRVPKVDYIFGGSGSGARIFNGIGKSRILAVERYNIERENK